MSLKFAVFCSLFFFLRRCIPANFFFFFLFVATSKKLWSEHWASKAVACYVTPLNPFSCFSSHLFHRMYIVFAGISLILTRGDTIFEIFSSLICLRKWMKLVRRENSRTNSLNAWQNMYYFQISWCKYRKTWYTVYVYYFPQER